MSIHKPVLLKETIDLLNLESGMTVIDATLGGGGHGEEIIKKILPGGKLIAIDQDKKAVDKFRNYLGSLGSNIEKENVILIHANFAYLKNIADSLKIKSADAIAADLGISSDQLDDKTRGFSFQKDGPLDMRMNPESDLTAEFIVNNYGEEELAGILKEFGEEKYAKNIAREICKARKEKLIHNTLKLVDIIAKAIPRSYKYQKILRKSRQGGTRGRHFATRTFQALRMEVNDEIKNLKEFLSQAIEVLRPGARIAIISFHSGEDRVVKNFFRENARGCICPPEFPVCCCGKKETLKIITRKPIMPNKEEIQNNPRSRSAKLRVAEKI